MKPCEEAILAAGDVQQSPVVLHMTGESDGGWKLLMQLHGGKAGL